jgi:methyl-accepting chemotaxis protein
MEEGNRRKKYFVDWGFQGRFILTYALICLAGMALVTGLFHYFASGKIDALRWKMAFRIDPMAEIVLPSLAYASISAAIFATVSLFIFSMYSMKKINKSVHKLQKSLVRVGNGNLTLHVKLTKEHHFQDFSEELDNMVTAFGDRFNKIKENFTAVRNTINALPDIKEELLPEKCAELNSSVRELKEHIKGP